jgi:hypothetical protein
MEFETTLIPRQVAVGNDAMRLPFDISDHVFIIHVEDAPGRQHAAPMRHQSLVMSVVATEFREVIGLEISFREKFGKTGDAGIHGIANGVNDDGIR